jgi:DNA-binding phage protein
MRDCRRSNAATDGAPQLQDLRMTTTTTPYDVAEHLRNEEEIRLYIEAAYEEAGDDAAFIAKILGNAARARGLAQNARDPSSL